jgi:hypothetical protein
MVAMGRFKDLTWDGSRKKFKTFENRFVTHLMDKKLIKAIQVESIKVANGDDVDETKQDNSNAAYQILLSAVSDLTKDDEDQSEAYRRVIKYGPRANPVLDDYKTLNRAYLAFKSLQEKYGDAVTIETVYSAATKTLHEFDRFEIDSTKDMEGELDRLLKYVATLQKYKVKRTSLELLIKIQKCIEDNPLYKEVVNKIREVSIEEDFTDETVTLNLLNKIVKLLISTYVSHDMAREETVAKPKKTDDKTKNILNDLKEKISPELMVLLSDAIEAGERPPICPICDSKGYKNRKGEPLRHHEHNCWTAHPDRRPGLNLADSDNGKTRGSNQPTNGSGIDPSRTDGIPASAERLGIQRTVTTKAGTKPIDA